MGALKVNIVIHLPDNAWMMRLEDALQVRHLTKTAFAKMMRVARPHLQLHQAVALPAQVQGHKHNIGALAQLYM